MMEMKEALEQVAARRSDELVVAPFTGALIWQDLSQKPEYDFPFWGAMGKASSTGLGLALALPDWPVWVIDGDGSLVMNLGSLITIAQVAPRNLVHMVLENGVYATTGGQPVPGAGVLDFVGMARSAGFPRVYSFSDVGHLKRGLADALEGDGPTFICLKVKPARLARERMEDRLPRRMPKQAAPELRAAIARARANDGRAAS